MSKRGVNLGAEFRYLERDFSGDLTLNHMANDRLRERDRWSVAWRNQADLIAPAARACRPIGKSTASATTTTGVTFLCPTAMA